MKKRAQKQRKRIINNIKMTLSAVSENEAFARTSAAIFASQIDPTTDEIADIRCAVSEAVTNVVVHAYKNAENREKSFFYINAKLYSDKSISFEIRDKGCGIPDIEKAMEPLYTTDKESERSGMGFAIMQSFMDKVRVSSKVGEGTRVFMEKKLTEKE